MMQDMRIDFENAAKEAEVKNFVPVGLYEYENILVRVLEAFTCLGKRGLNSNWLWNSFKRPFISQHVEYAPDLIARMFEPEIEVWFVAEDWSSTKKNGCYWVYETTISSALKVVGEMYGFEYYIVDKKLEWLVAENHHDTLFAVGFPAIDKLQGIGKPNKSNQQGPAAGTR